MEKKICLKCHEEKPLTHFYPTKFGGRINECASCKTLYHQAYRAKNRPRIREINALSKKKTRGGNFQKEKKLKPFVPKKCAKRNCQELSVQYENIDRFCKCHAIDYIFNIDDV